MDNSINMNQVFEKLNDLKLLFEYAQKIIPILQSLADFMQETVPLLEEINHSIADSTSKIPKATNQISSVTNATELATTEILDLVDAISNGLSVLEKDLSKTLESERKKSEIIDEIAAIVPENQKIKELTEKYKALDTTSSVINNVVESLPKLKTDTYSITLSLQVQDITSQQLAAVNHLIESVQDRLSSIIKDIDDTEFDSESIKIQAPAGATFDPNATYDKSVDRQDMVDQLINKENHIASQDEIDKLFS
jgi:chemotaxis regulatin CheY-phosphate phosphatase CheZ